jgi:hypothetical protein
VVQKLIRKIENFPFCGVNSKKNYPKNGKITKVSRLQN